MNGVQTNLLLIIFGLIANIDSAQELQILCNFTGTNGAHPMEALTVGNDGNFYGTTLEGGNLNLDDAVGNGSVFQITTNGSLTTLVAFNGTNGALPNTGLTLGNDGNFYGTTSSGGNLDLNSGFGYGTVFKMTTNWVLTTLATFNLTNGADPSGLTLGNDGNIYGITREGGNLNLNYGYGCGTVFQVTTNGELTTLVAFNETNGADPEAALILGYDDNFYGTTMQGGNLNLNNGLGFGTVFQLTTNWALTTLVAFNETNGAFPGAPLTLGNDGNFYGTTTQGGNLNLQNDYGITPGTVFKVTTNGMLTTLALFDETKGADPNAPLVLGNDGNLYSTTDQGGVYGDGTVFQITTNGVLSSLVSFPLISGSALTVGNDGNFYGTTANGGTSRDGVFFELPGPFEITGQPVSQTVTVGTNANFVVTTTGGSPLAYQWSLDGTNLVGATNGIFTISNVLMTNQGNYQVIVSGNYESLTSSVAVLIVNKATPTISTIPVASAITYGQTLASSTLNGGAASVAGIFSFNTPSIMPNAGFYSEIVSFIPSDSVDYYAITTNVNVAVNRAIATVILGNLNQVYNGTAINATATTTPTGLVVNISYNGFDNAPTNVGYYTVIGTISDANYQGSATNTLFIALGLPQITFFQPTNQTLIVGTNTSFSVTASGFSPLAYQWYFSNPVVQTTAGAMAETLYGFCYGTIVTNNGSGYTTVPNVQFIGGGGSGAGGTAAISNGMVTAITMTSAGSNYLSPPTVLIDPPSGLLIGQTNATLNLNAITTNNLGNYYVVISNAYGSVTSSVATLTQAFPPGITQPPQNQTNSYGSVANFSVTAGGTPPFSYQWWMVAGQQSNATAVPVVINGFVLTNTITSGGAGYLAVPNVRFVGGSGSGAVGAAVVSNRMVTAIIMSDAGSGYTVPPEVQIDPPAAIPLPGQTNSVLSLAEVTDANAGDYYVVVTNDFGSVTSSPATLTITGTFLPPQWLTLTATNGNLSLQFTGTPEHPYVLETATNLTPPADWQPVLTNPADRNGNWTCTVTNAPPVPARFYRAAGQ
jgi:uncharacterized repeat protein (TIGR03803 family)